MKNLCFRLSDRLRRFNCTQQKRSALYYDTRSTYILISIKLVDARGRSTKD